MALPTRYLIIGAGPSGLIAARAFLRYGIDVDIVERHTGLGGLWDIDNPGSPMYESCSMISSRTAGGFVGFPMDDTLAMYPKWNELYDYIREFAQEYHLEERCEFGVSVEQVTPVDTEEGRYFVCSSRMVRHGTIAASTRQLARSGSRSFLKLRG